MKNTGLKKSYTGNPVAGIITNGFFTVDNGWVVRYWNKAAEILLKVPAQDIVGKNLWSEISKAVPVKSKITPEKISLHFKKYWEEIGKGLDMTSYYCDNTLSVSFKSHDQSTDAEYPEQQLKMLNELYRFVTEVTNDSLWEWDLGAKEIFWIDGGHKRAFGYQIENAQIPQSFWESRLHPDDRLRVVSRLNKIVKDANAFVWEDEYRFQKADGDYAYVHDRGHLIYKDDKPSRMIGATQDISARKAAEMNLLESERKLSLIARETVNAVIITDAEGKIIWVNNAFTRITEYEPREAIGKRPGSFLQGPETNPATIQYIRQMINGKRPFECDIVNYTKSGRKYWMHLQVQALLDEKGNCEKFFAIETDITEKVALENKLMSERRSRQREITAAVFLAQEAERADIGKDLHDNLNQILGAAKLYIELAKENGQHREKYLDESCNYIINVIEELRKISNTLRIPAVHLVSMVENIKNLMSDVERNYPLTIKFYTDGLATEKLEEKLQFTIFRIVQEQLNNITKQATASTVVIKLARRGNAILLLISDNGQGFENSSDEHGISIRNIRSRAELYSGSAEIKSNQGKGFQLKVVLREEDHTINN